MKRVVFDTNIWVSALVFHGRVRRLREEAIHKRIQVAVSNAILEETANVLRGYKFRYSPEAVAAVEREIRDLARVVRPLELLKVVKDDPDDDRVLECAVASGAEIIVSGDRHLLDLGTFRGIRMMNPATFLAELDREGGAGKNQDEDVSEEETPSAQEKPAVYKVKGSKSKRVVKRNKK